MIRLFRDQRGARWEVMVGRESWGVLVAVFVSRDEDNVRQAILDATSREEATRLLSEVDEQALDELFQRSVPKLP